MVEHTRNAPISPGDLVTQASFMQKFNLKSDLGPRPPIIQLQVLSEKIAMYGLIFENFSGYIKVWYYALSVV